MPPIKNYSLDRNSSEGEYVWKHNLKPVRVIVSASNYESLYAIEVWNHAHMIELGALFTNKQDARKQAVEWMRKNPDGWDPN